MVYLKAAIGTILFLLIALTGYIAFSFDDKYDLKKAYDLYTTGNFDESLEILNKITYTTLTPQKLLYKAYIERDQGYLKASTETLNEAEILVKNDPRESLRLEIYYNQALNAYLSDSPEELEEAVNQASKVLGSRQSAWLEIFTYLLNEEAYLDSHQSLGEKNIHQIQPLSSWMKRSFQNVFSPFWQKTLLIRQQIHENNYVKARQEIEDELNKDNEKHHDELNLLMGLSYVKEAQAMPEEMATPYYKLAFSYYSKIPFHLKKFAKDREQFFNAISKQIKAGIENEQYQQLPFYLSALDQLEAEEEKNRLSSMLINIVNEQLKAGKISDADQLIILLNRILPEGDIRGHLEEGLTERLKLAIESGRLSEIKKYWKINLIFSSDDAVAKQNFASILEKEILKQIPSDNASLSKTAPLVNFFKDLDVKRKAGFANQLVSSSFPLLTSKNENAKAISILTLALNVPQGKEKILVKDKIKKEISKLYKQASSEDNYQELRVIYTTQKKLPLDSFNLISKDDEKKYSKEAQYFFANKDYQKAEDISNWILTVFPKNSKALIINGLINYYEGNYQKALKYLRQLKGTNRDILEAMAVSEILEGNKKQGMAILDKLQKKNALKETVLLKLGFGELSNKNPKEAIKWFNRIDKSNKEALCGLAIAAFQGKNWDQTLAISKELHFPYSKLSIIQSIQIQSLANLGDMEEAKEFLNQFLISDDSYSLETFSGSFQRFIQSSEKTYNRYITASFVYMEGIKDPKKALYYLDQVPVTTPEILLKKSEILVQMSDWKEAEKILVQSLELAKQETEYEKQAQLILPLLASVSAKMQKPVQTFLCYNELFDLNPHENRYRIEFIESLMAIKRFDLALQQMIGLQDSDQWGSENMPLLIEAYINTNNFSKANLLAKKWVNQNENDHTLEKIQLAKQMLITQNTTLAESIISNLPNNEKLSLSEKIALIDFFIAQGSFEEAKQIIETNIKELEQSSSGLFVIAQFCQLTESLDLGLKYAQQAREIDPQNNKIIHFINIHSHTTPTFSETNSQELSLHLNDIDQTLEEIQLFLINQDKNLKKQTVKKTSADSQLQFMQKKLNAIVNINDEIPEVYYLLGKLNEQLNFTLEAEEEYKKAIGLNIAYIEAYKDLGVLYLKNDRFQEAKNLLTKSIRFAPDESQTWLYLGTVEEEEGSLFDAISAYENSIKYQPNNATAYILLSQIELEVNNPEAAKKSLETSLSFEPDNVEALKLLLTTLYDPQLLLEMENESLVEKRKQEVKDRLNQLAPEELKKLVSEIDHD